MPNAVKPRIRRIIIRSGTTLRNLLFSEAGGIMVGVRSSEMAVGSFIGRLNYPG
jgi:hypothetical protein